VVIRGAIPMHHAAGKGQGFGRAIAERAVDFAGELGWEQLYLTCRSGTNLPEFYSRLGWREVGRMPGNLRLPDGAYRDEIYMLRDLKER
jgi:GNAT superfamily N-acetyltransferase